MTSNIPTKPLHDVSFTTIDCNVDIQWDTLTNLAKGCLKTGKTIVDGLTFCWVGGVGKLEIDQNTIDVEAFKTAIAALDASEEVNKSLLNNIREERTKRLQETDWMANSDVTMSDDWKTYRQALRDLPANTSDPANPTWPTKPS
tara:strand:+ start:723 stop:1154 length:432 start_codon:yes stop_codon:yes gene_type:complete